MTVVQIHFYVMYAATIRVLWLRGDEPEINKAVISKEILSDFLQQTDVDMAVASATGGNTFGKSFSPSLMSFCFGGVAPVSLGIPLEAISNPTVGLSAESLVKPTRANR